MLKVSAFVGISMRVSTLGMVSRTQYALLIYLSGKGSAKYSQGLVGGRIVFYDHRGGIVAERIIIIWRQLLVSLLLPLGLFGSSVREYAAPCLLSPHTHLAL